MTLKLFKSTIAQKFVWKNCLRKKVLKARQFYLKAAGQLNDAIGTSIIASYGSIGWTGISINPLITLTFEGICQSVNKN